MKTPNLVKAFSVRKCDYRLVKKDRCVDITFRFFVDNSQTTNDMFDYTHLIDQVRRCAEAGLADEFLPD